MLIYIEKQAKSYPQTQKILEKFKNAKILWIDNYKNIFDKHVAQNVSLKPSFIVAKLNSPAITKAPDWYGHNNKQAFFLKTSLNCIFDCSYCFLKGAFKNDIPVYFVNYEDIKEEILNNIKTISGQTHRSASTERNVGVNLCVHPEEKENNYELRLKSDLDYKDKIWFYSSDYSDILGMDNISGFLQEFVPFFENLNLSSFEVKGSTWNVMEGDGFWFAMMEIRTKSANIKPILDLWFVPKNTEFAFSLNPQELIDKYEKGTSSLEDRIKSINILLEKWYKVGLRFLPLLPVKNYKEIYSKFVEEIKQKIDIKKISSTFVSGLLYTKSDYNNILKKYPKLDVLYRLKQDDNLFVREDREVRDFFYNLFSELDKECFICLDEK